MRQATFDPRPGVSIATHSEDLPDRWEFTPHFHGSDQLIFATAGLMEVEAADHRWLIPPEFALWMPAGVAHSLRMHGRVFMRTLYIRKGLRHNRGCSVLNVTPLLKELIVEAVRVGNVSAKTASHRALRLLLLEQIDRAPIVPTALRMPQDPRVRALAEALISTVERNVSLGVRCRQHGISVRSAQRIFRRDLGTDFETWRCQVRLMKAIPMLVADCSIKQVAFGVGYRQASTFVAMFRRILGMTPKEFVARARRAPAVSQQDFSHNMHLRPKTSS
jgi:AraC-like DNA-binding protein